MAQLAVERIMDSVSLIVDCESDEEANEVYNMLASQLLDGKTIRLNIEAPPTEEVRARQGRG